MKLHETKTTVTTLDLVADYSRNAWGGSPLRMLAVVATTERGTYTAGAASEETRLAHLTALEKLGAVDNNPARITRGFRSNIELSPAGN